MDDLCLTWISNCENNIEDYLKYVKSIKKCKIDSHIVILTDNMLPETKSIFQKLDCIVETVPPIENVLKDRFLAFFNYLKNKSYDYVIITDARDVVFQENPLPYIRRNLWDKNLILSSEGFIHRVSHFNMIDQLETQRNVKDFDKPYMDWLVVNGGIVIGKTDYVKNFCFLVWTNAVKSSGGDQGMINYLYSYMKDDETCYLADPHDCPLVVTGEGIKHKLLNREVLFKDGKAMFDNHPYYIFHQWDRII